MKTLFTKFAGKVRQSSFVTMFSLAKEKSFVSALRKYMWKIISLSTGKVQIAPRLRRFNKFTGLLFKVYRNHGSLYTIKWLKANHMAVQRSLSSIPMKSLRELEPNLPLTRLINGLPPFIGTMDRKAIRDNHPGTIRLWLSILSIYRVIEGPVQPKLNTITDSYKGEIGYIETISKSFSGIIANCPSKFSPKLQVTGITRTLSSGPNNKVSLHSLITDAIAIAKYPEIYEPIKAYCLETKSYSFMKMLDLTINWCGNTLEKYGTDWVKRSKSVSSFDDIALGKLAFKEEAAGKLRIFAIADLWTQSLFRPLHDALFKFLRGIPNDATFDQDASFQRCLDKSVLNRSVYSVDLSSATDRLPIDLQVNILDALSGLKIGALWKSILVDRPYMIRENKYIPSGYVYYSTGQPMGCLSSWAMLAVTHHFIMQYCHSEVYSTREWNTDYEILGDDLVIFDTKLFQKYIEVMKRLDVGINLSKSLISDHLSALEFAKRTGVDGVDVSGISIKQLIAEDSALGRINQVIYFARKGLISSLPMLLLTLSKRAVDKNLPLNKEKLLNPLLSILGHLVNSGKITLESAVSFIVDPQDEDMEWMDNPSLPFTMTSQFVLRALNSSEPLENPLPNYSERLSILKEEAQIGHMANSLVRDALSRIKLFLGQYDQILDGFARALVVSPSDRLDPKGISDPLVTYDDFDSITKAQLRSFAEWSLLKDRDPQDLYDELYDFVYEIGADLPDIHQCQILADKVDNFISSINYLPLSKAMTKSEVPALLKELRNAGSLVNTPYWRIII